MKSRIKYSFLLLIGILLLSHSLISQNPIVENVRFEQRTDGSLKVDIYYDVSDSHGGSIETVIQASSDDGKSWTLPCQHLEGDVGENLISGKNKHVVWDFYKDNPNTSGHSYKVRVSVHENLCGIKIKDDLILTSDLLCVPENGENALVIAAPNLTIDLNGHKIWSGKGRIENSAGIWIDRSDGVVIKNGVIDKGFSWGIAVDASDDVLIEDIFIRNLEFNDPDTFLMGITTGLSFNTHIRNCKFEFLSTTHKEAVVFGSSQDFLVDGIEVISGSLGVNFGGDAIPSNGVVRNSTFNNLNQTGVLVQNSTYGLIHDNLFINSEEGIVTDALYLGEVSGLIIENNIFHDNVIAIMSYAGIESTIQNNTIFNNNSGIRIDAQMGCPPNGPYDDCYYSTDNIIRNNDVTDNFLDLFHHEKALGNTWENNNCETSIGSEIPPCNPIVTTAATFIEQVGSAVKEIAQDAELLLAASWQCDTFGLSYQWIYIYESQVLDERLECWYKNGEVIMKDSVRWPWLLADDAQSITNNWIDSDSTIVLAEQMGGKAFRDEFEIETIEMNLTSGPNWNVNYVSKDSILNLSIDGGR